MTYYPSKMLAYLVPSIVIVIFVFIPFLYTMLNEINVPRLDSTSHLSDDYSNLDRRIMQKKGKNLP